MQVIKEYYMVDSRDLLIYLVLAAIIVGAGLIAHRMDLGYSMLATGSSLYVGFIVFAVLLNYYQAPRQYLVVFDEGVMVSDDYHVLEERIDGTTLIREKSDNLLEPSASDGN